MIFLTTFRGNGGWEWLFIQGHTTLLVEIWTHESVSEPFVLNNYIQQKLQTPLTNLKKS